jgi:hypothetical protein
MDAALTAFLITLGIIGGILSPVILVAVFGAISNSMKALTAKINQATENLKRQPPFSDVEVNVNPATNVMTVRFDKDGVPIWQGSSSRREMEENNILKFKSQDVE